MENNNALKQAIRYFFSGTLFIVPLVATAYFLYVSFDWLDSLLHIPYPGVGFLILILAITGFGYLTTNFAFNTFSNFFESTLKRIPLLSLIYSSIKDLIEAFVGEKKKFSKPVLVTINKENNLYQVGFMTQKDLSELGLMDMVSVYLPHSYAFSGIHYVVPKEHVRPLNIKGTVAMKYIVSGGVSGFKEVKD